MRATAAAALAVAGLALAGCGADSEEVPRPAGAPREVVVLIDALEAATARGDFRRICDELYTDELREAAGGDRCEAELRRRARGLRDPRIRLRTITVRGDRATVTVEASARGQPPAPETLELVRQGRAYRVAALAVESEGGDR